MKNHSSPLAAKVAAVNRAHQMARELYPALVNAFKPFHGQKVIKVNGDLLASVEKTLPKLPGWGDTDNRACVFRSRSSSYSIVYTVKASENYTASHGCSSAYHEVSLYVCDLDGQTAKPVSGGGDWVLTARTDYTEAEVAQLRKTAEEARKAAQDAESACHFFGLYDR